MCIFRLAAVMSDVLVEAEGLAAAVVSIVALISCPCAVRCLDQVLANRNICELY